MRSQSFLASEADLPFGPFADGTLTLLPHPTPRLGPMRGVGCVYFGTFRYRFSATAPVSPALLASSNALPAEAPCWRRFLGRRVYFGAVIVLVSGLRDGLSTRRVAGTFPATR